MSLDQENPFLILIVFDPVAVVVTKVIEGIVFGSILIGEIPKLEPSVDHPVLPDIGLAVRVQLGQYVAVVPQDVVDVSLEGEVLGVLTVMKGRTTGRRTKLFVDAAGVLVSTFWADSFHNRWISSR